MISREKASFATRHHEACTELFLQWQQETAEWRFWDKILTRRKNSRRVWLFPSPETYSQAGTLPPFVSSSMNTPQTSTTPPQATVTCQVGQNKASFSGMRYRVVNQVVLFLMTGMNGDTSTKKSSLDLMREVASSSYFSALLRLHTPTKSTSRIIESLKLVTPRPEETASARTPLPVVDYSPRLTQNLENLRKKL